MILSPAVRSLKPSATIAAAAKAKALKSQGVKVYDFTLGEPDFNTPEHIQEAARAAMQAGHTHYTASGGIPELKQAICAAYERDYKFRYEPNQVVVSNGAKHSIHNVVTALCGPGDEVIIPAPYWVSYEALVELAGATPVIVQTTEASGFRLSAEDFEKEMTPKTKLLLLNSPCNPTGATYSAAGLEALARVAAKHNVFVCSDEIYEKLLYTDEPFQSFATLLGGIADRTIIISGVSKAYAMTGWRIGWTLAPKELTAAMDNLQSQETSNPCSVSQYAAVAALNGPQDCIETMRLEFARRRTYTLGRIRALPGINLPDPGGAFYVFFNVSPYFGKPLGTKGTIVSNATDFCSALLEDAHVALVTGDAFGAPGFVRLSFATGMNVLEAGCDRLASFLRV
jgi:aspartate aminotransferase